MQTWCRMVGLLLVVGLLGLAALGPARAEDEPKLTVEEERAAADAEHIGYLSTAAKLEEFGTKYKSPLALITAGELLLKVHRYTDGTVHPIEVPVVDEKGNKLDVPVVDEKGLDKQAEGLFDQARAAGGIPNIKALISAAEARAAATKRRADEKFGDRGAKGGPKRISRKVNAGSRQQYNIPFDNGQVAAIAIQSSHPVRFVIRDAKVGPLFNMVVTTGHYTWTPGRRSGGTTPIHVEVHGMGHIAQYTIQTN